MIKFEKVSYEQFRKDCLKVGIVNEYDIQKAYDGIELPKRGTIDSAGYDFSSPFEFRLDSHNSIETIPSGIRVIMPSNVCLILMPRSGLGFKSGMRLVNTLGLIDADYYNSENEGHIMMKFEWEFNDLYVKQFDRVMQGVFLSYLTTIDDDVNVVRNGGFGSTGE